MNTITLAKIYEKQGHLKEARDIYRAILNDNPDDLEARKALLKFKVKAKPHGNSKVSYFKKMGNKEQFKIFEKWLVNGWN